MGNKIWQVRFLLGKDDTECFVWKSYSLLESKGIVEELKSEIENSVLSPVNTWVLEHSFRIFDDVYKKQGYTLMSLSIIDKRKINATRL
jgi:hypothetical protein